MADTVQTVNTTTTNLPAYLQPYVEDLAARSQANSNRPYVTNPNQRVAGFDPAQTAAQSGIMGMERPGEYGEASGLATTAGIGALAAGQNYNPGTFTNQTITPGTFDQTQADKYMSPYIQSVIDAQKREAITDAQKTQLMSNLGAARQGTYGGSRELLAGTERERALGTNLSDIQAKGLQSAWEQAQSQYNADSNRGLQAGQSNQTADLRRQELGENSRQYAGTLGMQGFDTAMRGATTLDTLGNDVQNSDLRRYGAQSGVGETRQGLAQAGLDVQNADWERQNAYPDTSLNTYSSLLRGIPGSNNGTSSSTTSAPGPSTLSQIGGLGLGALSLANLLGGK